MYLISQGFIYLAIALIIGGMIGYALRACFADNAGAEVREELELARARYEAFLVGRTDLQMAALQRVAPAIALSTPATHDISLSALSVRDLEGALLAAAPGTSPKPRFEADDLTMIKGITPKLDIWLSTQGITRFTHLVNLTPAELYWLVENLPQNGTSVYRDHWVAQAAALIKDA
jgi:predicted flap endonuclease-1-like 5' DNA nuclease